VRFAVGKAANVTDLGRKSLCAELTTATGRRAAAAPDGLVRTSGPPTGSAYSAASAGRSPRWWKQRSIHSLVAVSRQTALRCGEIDSPLVRGMRLDFVVVVQRQRTGGGSRMRIARLNTARTGKRPYRSSWWENEQRQERVTLRRARPAETPHRASSSTHHSQCVGTLYADQWIVVGAMPLLLQIHSCRCKRLYVGPEAVMRLVGRVLGR